MIKIEKLQNKKENIDKDLMLCDKLDQVVLCFNFRSDKQICKTSSCLNMIYEGKEGLNIIKDIIVYFETSMYKIQIIHIRGTNFVVIPSEKKKKK